MSGDRHASPEEQQQVFRVLRAKTANMTCFDCPARSP